MAEAETVGYPVMLKSTAGGGGIGMQLCHDADALRERFATVQRTARASFGDARVYLERFVAEARHIEVQIFGDGKGSVVALGERDCSLQRRNQKVVEETPAPGLERRDARATARGRGGARARASPTNPPARSNSSTTSSARISTFSRSTPACRSSIPVTEAVFGVDLVEWMIRQAAGEDVLVGLRSACAEGRGDRGAALRRESRMPIFVPAPAA